MKARCGAAATCSDAPTVRQLQTQGKWWEAAGCVDGTDRVQLQLHAKLVAIQTEARPAVQSTQPAGSLQTFLAIELPSMAAPRKQLTVWISQIACRALEEPV